MLLREVTDLSECEMLWKKFSPDRSIWDKWEVAMSFYDKGQHQPYFIVVDEKGLVPLWYEKGEKEYVFFGGYYPENRVFWFEDEYFPAVFEILPIASFLDYIDEAAAEKIIRLHPAIKPFFCQESFNYFLNLESLNYDLKAYFKTFNKKHRKNFLYDLRKLQDLKYQTVWEGLEHFDDFINYNISKFGQDSDLADLSFVNSMRQLFLYFQKEKILHAGCIVAKGKVEGVEYAALYKGVYYVFNGGYNKGIPNLGKLLILEHIKRAIELRAKEINFMADDSGWKQLWNCQRRKYYTLLRIK